MRSIVVSPSAMRPAITRHAEARRSVAMTSAPVSFSTPLTTAVLPSTSMSAPSRRNSCTCIIRFSKIVSVMTAVPVARVASAMNCACMSVGNPGCGAVRTLTARRGPSRRTRMRSPSMVMSAPTSRSLSITALNESGCAPVTVTSPPAAAAAARKVPVSMRSGMIACAAPCSCGTPSIVMRAVPAPLILAPMASRHCARSITSGSRAALSSTVMPSASVAAINRFSVPVTVTTSNTMLAPRNRPRALM